MSPGEKPHAVGGFAEWQEAYAEATLRDADFETMSGVPLEPVYGPGPKVGEAGGTGERAPGEWPGVFPYTRGPYASMYRSKLWTMRMFAGFGTAEDTNARFHDILRAGGDGLSVAYDLPTLMGRDSDDPLCEGEVGRCGVAVDTLADAEDLFAGIDLGSTTTSMTINSPAAMCFAMYVSAAEAAGTERKRLGGTLQNDILKEYQAQKEYIFPPRPSLRLVTDIIRYCAAEMPRFHPVSVSGYHIREAGSTAAHELAFTLANGFAYVEAASAAGLGVDEFAPRLSFFFNAHIDFFEEIAKYRAARRIWATWMRDRYGAEEPRSLICRFHTQTAGVSLTAQQPELNIVRTAIEALAGVLGGTQSLHTNSMDEVLALPTEKAAGIAHLDELGDGSILDGVIAGIETNWFQGEIADAAYRFQRKVSADRMVIVGVNGFTGGNEDSELPTLHIGPEVEEAQRKRLAEVKRHRSGAAVEAALVRLVDDAGHSDSNLMPAIFEAVRAYATAGEMVNALAGAFGRWEEHAVISALPAGSVAAPRGTLPRPGGGSRTGTPVERRPVRLP